MNVLTVECVPECPIDAIKADTDENVKDIDKWLLLNKKFSLWPNISKKEPMVEHKKFREIKISMINTFQKNLENNYAKKKKTKKSKN